MDFAKYLVWSVAKLIPNSGTVVSTIRYSFALGYLYSFLICVQLTFSVENTIRWQCLYTMYIVVIIQIFLDFNHLSGSIEMSYVNI